MNERIRICNLLRDSLLEKQSNTKIFMKNIITFFEDEANIYVNLAKNIEKMSIKNKYQNESIHKVVKDSIG